MTLSTNKQVRSKPALIVCILVILLLYLLQGVTLGLTSSISVYLASFGASWKQQGILSFSTYPFSLKLLWAPIIDAYYIRQLGRRQTWLLPIQFFIGFTLIILSFCIDSLLVGVQATQLTIIFFFIIFLTATQDICVDGWALTLFAGSNVIWQSVSQMIGQPLGGFIGSPFLLVFESTNLTNQMLRRPLGIAEKPYGLFTLTQFVRFWGGAFLLLALIIAIVFREQPVIDVNGRNREADRLGLMDIYYSMFKLFKKKCFCQLAFILIGSNIGDAATSSMTYLTLMSYGFVTRDTLGLITMPLIIVKVSVPLLLTKTSRPLIFFARSYIPRLVLCATNAIFIILGHHLRSHPILFHFLLVLLLGLNDAMAYAQAVARGGFFAQICDTRIGGTYYTLLASISNAGQAVSSSLVLYTANWFPKEHAYSIEVGICLILGLLWFAVSLRLMYQLQALPVESWHLDSYTRSTSVKNCRQNKKKMTNTSKQNSPTDISGIECSSWL